MDEAVVTKDLRKSYGQVDALRGVDLTVHPGEVFGLLGPNGAGKTTLQQILCTLLRPTSGEARVAGVSVVDDPEAVRRNLGVVFQVPTLDLMLTARENLRIHGRLYRVPKADVDARIPELLALAGLEDRADHRTKTFSGGMRRRLELVRALMHRPKILLLDEPTIGLDPQSRRLIWGRLGVMRKEYDITVLLTTHYMDEADQLCDRIAVIDHGRIIALDHPRALKAKLGNDLLELRLASPPNGILARVGELPSVVSAQAEGDRVLVRLQDPAETIPLVVSTFARAGVPVLSMEHKRLTMDDVFLDLTGRVRDKPPPKKTRFQRMVDRAKGLFA
jgi:ABC-2 type transport system ATP-binding protein